MICIITKETGFIMEKGAELLKSLNLKGDLEASFYLLPEAPGKPREICVKLGSVKMIIPEQQFYMLSACAILARKQFEISKSAGFAVDEEAAGDNIDFIPEDELDSFFCLLNEAGILYCLIDDPDNKISRGVKSGKPLTLIVNDSGTGNIFELLGSNGFISIPHPFGETAGWSFPPNLNHHKLYKKNIGQFEFLIDVRSGLCCHGLTPKTWVSFDGAVNKYLFENMVFDSGNNCWRADKLTYLFYIIAVCVFNKKKFNENYVTEIESNRHLMDDPCFIERLSSVFYSYTGNLLTLMKSGDYDKICEGYFSFRDY